MNPLRRLTQLLRSALRPGRRLAGWLAAATTWDWLLERDRHAPRPRRFRPALEGLEERLAPSVTANNDSWSAMYGQNVTIAAGGVLANDTGSGLTAALVTQASYGSVSLNSNGGFTWTKDLNHSGP